MAHALGEKWISASFEITYLHNSSGKGSKKLKDLNPDSICTSLSPYTVATSEPIRDETVSPWTINSELDFYISGFAIGPNSIDIYNKN